MAAQKSPKVTPLSRVVEHANLQRYLDGVTVAKAITLKDKFENLGAR
jgi:hypothetical protein